MLRQFLLPETVSREDGTGSEMPVDVKVVQLTLGITRNIAQESLEISVWGSPDGEQWRLLVSFPQKYYCGTYAAHLDLNPHADVRYLRAQWKMGNWIRDKREPLFEFYLIAEEGMLRKAGAA